MGHVRFFGDGVDETWGRDHGRVQCRARARAGLLAAVAVGTGPTREVESGRLLPAAGAG